MKPNRTGFTLLELLVVIAIVTILLVAALPQFQGARTRGKATVARAHIRSIVHGLELYAADHRRFPETRPQIPGDPLALLSDHQLSVLTSPVVYVNAEALRDPFGVVEARILAPNLTQGNDFPRLTHPNAQRSLLYFHYPSLAASRDVQALNIEGSSTISIGPDRVDSLGTYRPLGEPFFLRHFAGFGIDHPYDTLYDPTNGTHSGGDIGGYAGEARGFIVP